MTFKPKRTTVKPLFKESGILTLSDYITHQNCMFAHDCINRKLPNPLQDDRIAFVQTSGNTRAERLNQLVNFRTNTVLYGTKSIKARAVQAWNDINIDLHNLKLQDASKSLCKKKVYEYLLDKYPGNNNNNNNNNNGNMNTNNNNSNNAANNNLSRINANRNIRRNDIVNNNNNNRNPYDLSGIRVLTYRRNNTQPLNANWTGQGLINRWDN